MNAQDYFFKVKSPDEVQKTLKDISYVLPGESVGIEASLGRILAEDVYSPVDLPGFERSTMDGFAVRARDTFGASAGSPAYLRLAGEVKMGETASMKLSPGEAIGVSTGSMVPEGADAIVIIEHTDILDDETIEVVRPVAPGDNLVRKDEDISKGSIMLRKGRMIRPHDIGALAGAGILEIKAIKQPEVAIISSGDEIIQPDQKPQNGQIRDINTYSLSALARQAGALPISMGIVKDSYELLRHKLLESIDIADIALISGGSSVGTRDATLDVIQSIPDSEILVHGISIRPGKPTIIAKAGRKYIFGLPGNPVSVMVTFDLFVGYLIKLLSGIEQHEWKPRYVKAFLSRNLASAPGREDYVCVRLVDSGKILAEPVLGKSALITMMVRADGLIKIPLDMEGLEAGTEVDVFVF